MNHEMKFELFQPWSTFVIKTKLPSEVLEKMIRITDEIVENRAGRGDEPGAGQLIDQFFINFKILEQEEVMGFFLEVCRSFVIQAYCQSQPFNKEYIMNEQWLTQLTRMWVNSQKDNEYFPNHIHTQCAISSVMYLKIPEYLPSRKTFGNIFEDDGALEFSNNTTQDQIWGSSDFKILPQVGDFFIFPATQRHQVYPFRTADGKGERRSVSFNADFSSKTVQANIKKQQLTTEGEKIYD